MRISGAKNAVLPILCATLFADEPVRIDNVPHLHDVSPPRSCCGSGRWRRACRRRDDGRSAQRRSHVAPYELVDHARLGAGAAARCWRRFGDAEVSLPGGCAIGSRPVDLHIKVLQALGAKIDVEHGFIKASDRA